MTKKKKKGNKQRESIYDFDSMNPGDSFFYEGARSAAIIAFGYRAIKGCFSTEKEIITDAKGNIIKVGWRFVMKCDPTKTIKRDK